MQMVAAAAEADSADRTLEETEFLLKSPKNAARLRKSIASLEAGRVRSVQVDELVDLE